MDKGFEIIPCDVIADIDNRKGFKKLELTSSQKIQMSGLLQQLPAVMATNALSGAYMVKFPEGIPKVLTSLEQGGFSTMVKGENGRFVGSASLYPIETQAVILGVFSAMSIVSGQYFLAQINSELKTMNQSIDKILAFLYGDKKAELMAEVSFVKYAYQNYGAIMEHESQRTATIVSLQEARKVAMKDIEFYMSDLDSVVNRKAGSDIAGFVDKAFQIKDCLELSMQLYSMSSLLEIYYAQNHNPDYISNVEEEAAVYIGKCEKRMLSDFAKVSTLVDGWKEKPSKKIDKSVFQKSVGEVIDQFGRGTESDMLKSIRSVLHAAEVKAEYYMNANGDLYLKTA